MTPEEFKQHLEVLRQQQEAAIQDRMRLAQQEAQEQSKQRLYTSLGALAGAGIGIGLLKLLNRKKGQEKAEELATGIGQQCSDALQDQIAGFLGKAAPQQQPPDTPTFSDGDIKDADFDIVD
ncbi:MAG: hypothetical protein F6K48_03380 [Okeania sp. SIO3H1]|nr:hypothetical protein [Okeania sp. SIO3H1]